MSEFDGFKIVKINEQKQEDKEIDNITVIVLTKIEGETSKHIELSCKKKNISFFKIDISEAFITNEEKDHNKIIIHNYDGNNKKLILDVNNTICFVRGSSLNSEIGKGFINSLEKKGIFVINSLDVMEKCSNKLSTHIVFESAGISSPKTAVINNENNIDIAHKKIGGQFPVIIKTLTGAEGIGVSIVESYRSLKSVLQTLWKQKTETIIQEYMEIDYDVRTLVLNGKIIASTKRVNKNKKNDFRTNKARGAEVEGYKLSEEEKEMIINVANSVGGYYIGTDHIIKNGKIYFLEVNGSPGSGGKYQKYYSKSEGGIINGEELIDHVIEYISNKENWIKPEQTVGRVEWIEIDEIGKVKSKIDTGNGSYNSLHATDIEIKNNKITFNTINNKKITKNIIDEVHIKKNIKKEIDEEEIDENKLKENRPVVEFDVIFNNKKYKNIKFSLDDRSIFVYPVLLGKEFIGNLNLSVNVNKKFTFIT